MLSVKLFMLNVKRGTHSSVGDPSMILISNLQIVVLFVLCLVHSTETFSLSLGGEWQGRSTVSPSTALKTFSASVD